MTDTLSAMTLVSLAVTDAAAAAPVADARQEPVGPGYALYVGVPESAGLAGRVQLAELAQKVARLVEEIVPGATTHSSLALGTRGSRRELVARLGAELAQGTSATERARAAWTAQRTTTPPRVVVDTDARTVRVDGTTIRTTFKEFALLTYLLRSRGRAVPRDELLDTVWHRGVSGPGTRTIDVHVRRLREKLGGCLQIVTIRGVGYRCDPSPEVVLVGSGDAG